MPDQWLKNRDPKQSARQIVLTTIGLAALLVVATFVWLIAGGLAPK